MNLIFGMVRVFEIAVFALVSAGNRLGEAEFSAKQNPRMPTWRFVALDFPNANIFQTQTFSKREPIFSKREHFQNAVDLPRIGSSGAGFAEHSLCIAGGFRFCWRPSGLNT
jgi:hypothetical protein